ncbi:unnamed protein product [Lymnaea stagnalis]|uniref:Sodium-influx-stimulating peptide n=2 Tax=Lymnaea stagnalis TaxID=6523 RepID=SIS_LYMST|nr:RecName: Full=Sodium-influx-stimulating peptide; Flags: Precursor [Lymnaea stagnalis]CAA51680.1 SIS [Lymnaea stagnalis]
MLSSVALRYLLVLSLAFLAVVTSSRTQSRFASYELMGTEGTECVTTKTISQICYQCATRHEDSFVQVYQECCKKEMGLREYCEEIYTELPIRSGLWQPNK